MEEIKELTKALKEFNEHTEKFIDAFNKWIEISKKYNERDFEQIALKNEEFRKEFHIAKILEQQFSELF